MTTRDDRAEKLAALTRLLDAWGGDPARWPQQVGHRIGTLSQELPDAARLLDEARALDRALNAASAPRRQVRPGLIDDIVARAAEEEAHRHNTVAGRVVPFRRTTPAGRHDRQPRPSPNWQAAALMAASLLAGIYIGGMVDVVPAMQDIAESIGISLGAEPTTLALGDELGDEGSL